MYHSLKNFIKSIIPNSLLFKAEPLLRKLMLPFYLGNNYECTICNKSFGKFIRLSDGDKLCPNCGSISRTRRLWNLVNSFVTDHQAKILDFSPSRSFYRSMKKKFTNYSATDLSGDFVADHQYDITNLSTEDNGLDVIICYHILEHVIEDDKAMRELYRVLKPGGFCLVQTPFTEGKTYEDFSITSPAERALHFGQSDHVRIYSVHDLEQRLISTGFQVEKKVCTDQVDNRNGLKPGEVVLICKKAS